MSTMQAASFKFDAIIKAKQGASNPNDPIKIKIGDKEWDLVI